MTAAINSVLGEKRRNVTCFSLGHVPVQIDVRRYEPADRGQWKLPSAVVFDFDYTLADSSSAVIACVAHAFERMELAPVSADAVRATIGLSLPETLVRLAGEGRRSRAQEFRRHFRELSDKIMVERTTIFPFVPETLRVLRLQGLRLGIVSTKFRCRIEDVLERDGLRGRFEAVVGGDDVTEFKPSPEGLLAAADSMRQLREAVLYVGDSVTDAETARRAEIPFAAVLSGTTPAAAFARYEPAAVLASIAALPRWLNRSGRKRLRA